MSNRDSSLYRIVLVTVLTMTIVVGATIFAVSKANNLETGWKHFSNNVVLKQKMLSELRGHLGYDGMIHHFKNYIIRKTPQRYELAMKNISKTLTIIAQYQETGEPSKKELSALKTITDTVNVYQRNLLVAKNLVAQGKTTEQIDAVVKINDTDATTALYTLSDKLSDELDIYSQSVSIEAGQISFIIMVLPIIILACMFIVILTIVRV